jgi:hypothetical protein
LVNSKFGESGMSDEDGTMVCCFDLKKSRNDWRICADVIIFEIKKKFSEKLLRGRAEVLALTRAKSSWTKNWIWHNIEN